ncbi:hypothetical protein IIA16_01440 [bacterium]|nr:hypothetical protein [bacterium]
MRQFVYRPPGAHAGEEPARPASASPPAAGLPAAGGENPPLPPSASAAAPLPSTETPKEAASREGLFDA